MIDISRKDIRFAIDAVQEAAELAQRVQTGLAMLGIEKSDLSPVTVADYGAQALVARRLKDTFPDDVLVGEESSQALRDPKHSDVLGAVTEFVGRLAPGVEGEQVCDWIDYGTGEPQGRFWTLDPIDGTKGYLRGDQYAVAFALIEDGQVQLGVLACPRLNERCEPDDVAGGVMLVAARGEGSWAGRLEPGHKELQPLHVSEESDPKRARILRSVEKGHTNIGELDYIAEHLGVDVEPVRLDSQAKYAVLASGGAEMLFRLLHPQKRDYRERIWDQAAGSIVLEEAGGRITDLEGKPLDFSQGRKLEKNRGVFASNGRLHDAGLEAIHAVAKL